MKRWNTWQVGLQLTLASSLVGTTFISGCLGKIGSNINPCGTILDCDPVEWDLMFHDYPDWDIDPTCTIPGLCGGQWPPTSGGGGGGGGDTTTTTDTTTDATTTTDTGTTTTTTGTLFPGGYNYY